MPYHATKSVACPISKPWAVVKDSTRQVMGCHATEDDADAQVAALYSNESITRAKYDGIDFTPPEGVRKEAEKGLEWRKEFGRGGTGVGVARARNLSNGDSISPDTIQRMVSYFARHEVDKKGEGWSPGEKGFPSNGRIAWALWGGDPGKAWANKVQRQMESRDKVGRMSNTLQPSNKLVMRFVSATQPSGVAVVATETPIQRYDSQRGMVISEVLLMNGVRFRGNRNQIPIVDSHDDATVRNILGSLQDIQVDSVNGELFGTVKFSSDVDAQMVATRFFEGHITDFSITALPLESTFIPRGQSYITPRGVTIDGPAEIITAWEPHNASICATGADPNSTVRRSYFELERVERMDEALLGELKSLGLPDGMTDVSQIMAWVIGKMKDDSTEDQGEAMPAPMVESSYSEEEKSAMVQNMDEHGVGSVPDEEKKLQDMVGRALQADRTRRNTIQADCKVLGIERAFADELCESDVSLDEARARILRKVANKEIGSSVTGYDVRATGSEDDKFFAAARDGLLIRSAGNAHYKGRLFEDGRPADGAKEFASVGLKRMAEQFLVRRGVNTSRMADPDIAKAAMGYPTVLRQYKIEREAYHTTGSFSNLMLDAANKTLLAAYEEAPFSWSMWARQAASVPDFKQINRIRFSESPNLEIVPERHDYPEKAMSDSKESYTIDKYGAMFSVSWETVVNDDLDAISRIPAMHGNAARRRQNQAVYAVLTGNANMADGGALFNTTAVTTAGGHANQSASAAAPSVATLNNAFVSMMRQTGLNSSVILNIQPRFLIVPATLSATALQLVNSIADPGAGGNVAGNSNTLNIYGPQGMRNLQVIIEPQLDASSTSIWYLAADSGQIDTVELAFLQGEESPVLETDWEFTKDVYLYKVRQTFGVKAIDYRGLYRNA